MSARWYGCLEVFLGENADLLILRMDIFCLPLADTCED